MNHSFEIKSCWKTAPRADCDLWAGISELKLWFSINQWWSGQMLDLKKDLKKVLTVKYSTTEPEQWRAMATLAIFISLSSGLSKRMLENWWGDYQQYNQQLTNQKHKHQHQHYSSTRASTSMISVSIVRPWVVDEHDMEESDDVAHLDSWSYS